MNRDGQAIAARLPIGPGVRAANPQLFGPDQTPAAAAAIAAKVAVALAKALKPKKPRRAIEPNHENNTDRQIQNAQPQRDQAAALGSAVQGEAKGIRRARVRFTGYRVRPLDPDNFAGSVKDLLDGCRHAGLIVGDEPWNIILETEQVRVKTFAEEKTVIEITTP